MKVVLVFALLRLRNNKGRNQFKNMGKKNKKRLDVVSRLEVKLLEQNDKYQAKINANNAVLKRIGAK